jgi:hypothetical protein
MIESNINELLQQSEENLKKIEMEDLKPQWPDVP